MTQNTTRIPASSASMSSAASLAAPQLTNNTMQQTLTTGLPNFSTIGTNATPLNSLAELGGATNGSMANLIAMFSADVDGDRPTSNELSTNGLANLDKTIKGDLSTNKGYSSLNGGINGKEGQPVYTPVHTPTPINTPSVAPAPVSHNLPPVIAVGGDATIWGDPHFVGAEGEKYDIKGEPGQTYNILSDKDLQLNALFRAKGADQTLIGAIGATIRNESDTYQVKATEEGELFINGEAKQEGTYQLGSSVVSKRGTDVIIKTPEHEVRGGSKNGEMALNFKSDNVAADGVLPHGLWGQTADGDGNKRIGDEGGDAQGGGVLQKLDGTLSSRGDKTSYKLYQTDDLFDTKFSNFNHFDGQAGRVGNAQVAAVGSAD